jgi:hypothetical protein
MSEKNKGKVVGDLLKKAVSLGAGAYVSAEESVAKTLSTVNLPKELLREMIEDLFESYTVTVTAQFELTPKKRTKE